MEAGTTRSIVFFKGENDDLQHVSGNSFTYAPGVSVLLGGFDVSLCYKGYKDEGFIRLRLGFFI